MRRSTILPLLFLACSNATPPERYGFVTTLGSVRVWLGARLLRFIGVSGWFLIPILILENRVAMPLPGGNTTLDVLQILTVALWLAAKLETHIGDSLKARLAKA